MIVRALTYVGRGVLSAGRWGFTQGAKLWGTTSAVVGRAGSAKWFWRTLDIASWGFIVWDLIGDDDSAEALVRGNDYFTDIVLDRAVTLAITTSYSDREAVRYAFSNQAIAIFSQDSSASFLKGMVYSAVSDYLGSTSSQDDILYSIEDTKNVLSQAEQLTASLYPNGTTELGEAAGSVTAFLSSANFEELPFEGRKQMDFLAHFFTLIGEIMAGNNNQLPANAQNTMLHNQPAVGNGSGGSYQQSGTQSLRTEL